MYVNAPQNIIKNKHSSLWSLVHRGITVQVCKAKKKRKKKKMWPSFNADQTESPLLLSSAELTICVLFLFFFGAGLWFYFHLALTQEVPFPHISSLAPHTSNVQISEGNWNRSGPFMTDLHWYILLESCRGCSYVSERNHKHTCWDKAQRDKLFWSAELLCLSLPLHSYLRSEK